MPAVGFGRMRCGRDVSAAAESFLAAADSLRSVCNVRVESVIDVYWSVSRMIAVVETEEFLADVKGILSEDERDALILSMQQRKALAAQLRALKRDWKGRKTK